jgi:hypothetical protein
MADQHYWTWGGTYFGYRIGDNLFTHGGKHVGKFHDEGEIYGADGRYLGEVRRERRLITKRSKQARRRARFIPRTRTPRMRRMNYVGYVMYAGYEDFPAPDVF